MNRVFQVAVREFLATVSTKGFIFGLLATPLILAFVAYFMPKLMNEAPPRVEGEVAIVDPTGAVFAEAREALRPEAIAERRDLFRKMAEEQGLEMVGDMPSGPFSPGVPGSDDAQRVWDLVLGRVPDLEVVELSAAADLEREKRALYETEGPSKRLAIVVVDDDAVAPPDGESFGRFEIFVREKIDERITDEIRDSVRSAIVDARVAEAGMDRERIDKLTRVGRVRATTVTAEGEKETNELAQIFLPMGFMLLLLMSVMSGGQYLMTSTVEEKSSRVVEILLSAVSPMELMAGKVLGQFFVGSVILALYAGAGATLLVSFALFGVLELHLVIALVVFYLIAFFTYASLMAAIGAAVNQMSEAQTLMFPIIMTIMVPWILWLPISRDPNATWAVAMSFIPPINSFVTLLRMASTDPPPMWQVAASAGVGIAGVVAAIWFAAKVFRIGILMHGKPPNFATLVRWVRLS